MNTFKNTSNFFALLLALLTVLCALAGCESSFDASSTPKEENSPSSAESSKISGEESTLSSPSADGSETPVSPSPSNDQQNSPSDEQKLPINKENALEKLISGYNATMNASSAKLSGIVSQYSAGSGKGDTVSHGINFSCTKDGGVFKANLYYGGSAVETECYFEGTKKYIRLTDKETGELTVTATENTEEYTISTTVMPVLSESLTITSYENAFRRFCDTDFGVDFRDGVYTLYFYGSYTELARICLEDEAYENFAKRNVEEQFTTSASMEIHLTEDGLYKGMTSEINLESPERSMKSTISYTFTDIGGAVTVEKPSFTTEA